MITHLKTYFTHSRSVAVGLVFASMGFLFGNWVTLIPSIKQRFDLNDAELGILLLSMPFGSTFMNPIATMLINRYGMKQTTVMGMAVMAVCYALPVQSPTLWLVSLTLVLTGMSLATTNVAMNTCVTAIEQYEGISIMSTSHGMFSAGGMVGSALASLLIGLRVSPSWHMVLVSSSILLLAILVKPYIMSIYDDRRVDETPGAKFLLPRGALVGMILISLCTNITEGTMADWTAIYMRDVVHANDFLIGWGFAGYALFMATGRFIGDTLIPRFGSNRVLIVGGILAALGTLLAVMMPYSLTAILGFSMVGAGVSCGAPILYGAAARLPGMAKGAGLATMNTFSIAGFLAGPAIIGVISEITNLSVAISLVIVLGITWAGLATRATL